MSNTTPNATHPTSHNFWLTLILITFSLGLYYPIWFLLRRDELNALSPCKKLSNTLPILALVIQAVLVFGFVLFFLGLPYNFLVAMAFAFILQPFFSLLFFIFILVYSFRVRAQLMFYADNNQWRDIKISGVLTFIFSVVYLEYKINQLAGRAKKAGSAVAPASTI